MEVLVVLDQLFESTTTGDPRSVKLPLERRPLCIHRFSFLLRQGCVIGTSWFPRETSLPPIRRSPRSPPIPIRVPDRPIRFSLLWPSFFLSKRWPQPFPHPFSCPTGDCRQ